MPFRLLIALLSLFLAVHAALAAEPSRRATAVAAVARPAAAAPVNVNKAGLEQLVSLKGVGEKKARAIIAWRREHGPFNSLEQFEEVPGIGPAMIEQNRARIVFR